MIQKESVHRPSIVRRFFFVGMAVMIGLTLLVLIPPTAQSSEVQQTTVNLWHEVLSEDFEGGLGTGWISIDNSTDDGGDYRWGTTTYTSTSASQSVWSVGGGTDGSTLVAGTDAYPAHVDSWLVYGPINVSRFFKAQLTFDWWLDSQPGDWFGWCLATSVDPNNLEDSCNEVRVSGSIGTWVRGSYSLDLDPVSTQTLYVVFRFTSGDNGDAAGAFVDNVVVRVLGARSFLPLVLRQATPTPTPVPELNYFDDFSNPASGWATHTAQCCFPHYWCDGVRENLAYKYELYYSGNRYHIHIPTNCLEGGNHGWTRHIFPISFAPGVQRPTGRTCIEMAGSFENTATHASRFGLVFAASADMSTEYSVVVDDRGDWAVIKSTGYLFPGPNHSYLGTLHQEMIVPWAGGPRGPARPAMDVNVLRAEVIGGEVNVFINGVHVHTFHQSDIPSLRYVGILGGSWEWGNTRIGYDYFYVDEGCNTY